ncbi:endocuticle structural glycoprotein SgAbd-3-like [Thrips palmi]|uniref:Endocuticle structural glycoprotein SgAbd-3-like n=1 Tax=Thrips palmi TaxID=161013 RepID=A0A6P9A261_THRPL|nr:endocuticle structural glycoprotein SgAbd-3-like [Thrips palmi]
MVSKACFPWAVLPVLAALLAACGAAPQLGAQKPIAIVRLDSDISPDGTFSYTYETENRIQASAQGRPGNGPPGEEGTNVVGQFSFVAPDDGQTYSVQYTADENGFVPQGAHLPTPPPLPEAIVRALQQQGVNPADYGGSAASAPRAQQPFGAQRRG